jgi:hypothetical protein
VLLLVLILVLIAFGLLVVALLSGSVLWAWVSVGISVAAAAVQLIDWLQRRNAVKAGADAAAGTGGPGASPPRTEVEPVTEILPVIPPSGTPMAGAGGVNGAPRDVPAARFDQVLDGTQTVIMPVVQPSGSGDRPPGATPGISPSSGDSSPSVTKVGGDRSSSVPRPSDMGDVTGIAPGSAGPAEKPDDRPAASAAPPATPPEAADTARRVPGTTGGAPSGASDPVPVDLEKADRRQTDRDESEGDTTPEPDAAPASDSPADRRDAYDAEATMAVDARPADTPAGPAVSDEAPADSSTADADVASASTTDGAVEGGSPAGDATTAMAEATGGDPVLPPPGTDVEPPEESRDVAAAALVATLEDEVLVIDEQPRYHVESCRLLAGNALIPLPAREAIELGFTPCGWCAPDRTLASRHSAPAR